MAWIPDAPDYDACEANALPYLVRVLRPRMREIATIVYLSGGATASDVHASIDDPITVFGIRTMLRRLVKKGIVKCRPSGRHSQVLYLPAIFTKEVEEITLKAFLNNHFDGSARSAMQIMLQLTNSEEVRTRV